MRSRKEFPYGIVMVALASLVSGHMFYYFLTFP